jgi:OOP family OmpA-OmpF porin
MRFHTTIVGLLLALGAATPLQASPPPAAADRIDPKAPCYRWPAVDWDGDGVFDRVDYCNDTPRGCTVDRFGCSTDSDHDGVCDGVDRCPGTAAGLEVDERGCANNQRATGRVQPPPAEPPRQVEKITPKVPAPSRPMSESERQLIEGGRIRLENVYFETNSAVLLPESEAALREAGDALEKFAFLRIEVEGHTDTRGTASHNMHLSQARAEAVALWLIEHYRLFRSNLIAKGYGEARPETRERNDEEMLRNRRVVLSVLNAEDLPKGVKVENKP